MRAHRPCSERKGKLSLVWSRSKGLVGWTMLWNNNKEKKWSKKKKKKIKQTKKNNPKKQKQKQNPRRNASFSLRRFLWQTQNSKVGWREQWIPRLEKRTRKGEFLPIKQAFQGVFSWPWQKYVQKGRYPYFLRVTQSSKKIQEKLNCTIPALHRSEVTGLAVRWLEYQMGSTGL